MIKLTNISKKYNEVDVLKDININFREKEFVSILGPSGSGKSTLLNIISAIEKPDEGHLYLGDLNIFQLKKKKQDYYRANYINYIFQNYNLINYLSVKDNLQVGLNIKGYKQSVKKSSNKLTKLGLNKLMNKSTSKLSGGEQQRVAIARSLIADVKILLADEPTGALDSSNSIKVMNILKNISEKKLVIVVTHNEELAKKYSSRIIRINDGSIIEDSNPYNEINNENYNLNKSKLSLINTIKMSLKNLKNKKVRTYLTTLAFSIGLISLTLVLAISNGFNKEIKHFEEKSLYNYPLVISRERLDLNKAFDIEENVYKDGVINITNNNSMLVTNDIDESLLNKVKTIDEDLIDGISLYKNINNSYKDYMFVSPNDSYFDLIVGDYPKNEHEILLLLDSSKSINEVVAKSFDIKEVKYESIINKQIKIENKLVSISGVVISNNDYFKDYSGIIYNSDLVKSEIIDIFIFPKDYKSKLLIKEQFKDYNLIDDSETVISMTKGFVSGISYVLIAFSIISLIVSIIMISIVTYISVLERYREIGILKSLGATSKDIKKLFLSENLIIGIFSSIITLEVSTLLSNMINKFIANKIEMTNILLINNKIVFVVLTLSLLLTYVAGLIPARIASKKKIVDVLKHD